MIRFSQPKPWFLLGLFLICMCTLMLQIIQTRILSVISYYHLAFLSISIAMFGMTAGSLFVYFQERWFPSGRRLFENLVWICSGFAIAVELSTLSLISTVLMVATGKTEFLMMVLLWLKLIVILAPPYFFAGMAISLALTRSPWPVSLVYSIDLVGAATGCLVVLAVLTFVDPVSALFFVGAVGALAAIFFASARRASFLGEPLPPVARLRMLGRPSIRAAAFALLAFGNAAIQPYGLKLSFVKNRLETAASAPLSRVLEIVRWNSFSRVHVRPSDLGTPHMWGPSPDTPPSVIEQREMAIDGSAGTPMYRFDGDFGKLEFLKYDVTNLAYYIRHAGRGAVIGVGGGRDLLSAYLFGFRDITGVELNPIFIDADARSPVI
jgi:hypothetical protein